MFPILKDQIARHWVNSRGWHSGQKIMVIESDDWGAVRMPGRMTLDLLARKGLRVAECRYDQLDCLETGTDLEALFQVLIQHRDSDGVPPKLTANLVLGNPDFDAIRVDDFVRYTHEDLFHSYERYHGQNLRPLWDDAIQQGLIVPQFHGREHLNVGLWLKDLREGHKEARFAFEHGYYGLTTKTSSPRQSNYLAACWAESEADLQEISSIVEDGLARFNALFGFRSKTFVPCNYVLPEKIEEVAARCGVRLIQSQRGQLVPRPGGGAPTVRRPHTGQVNRFRQRYSVRNVKFEPFEDANKDWVGSALREISAAFRLGAPAIVCTHRVNYVGGLDPKHRDRSLRLLDELLAKILDKWPEVRFLTSNELAALMEA